jgi:hypothetical protein
MTPFIPPPPSCAARSVQEAGKTTRKLMGLAAGSIGAIAPSTAQYAAAVSVGAVHFGSATATLDTGSPIAPTGITVPSFADVQSASVIVLRSPISGSGATAACAALSAPRSTLGTVGKLDAMRSEAMTSFEMEFMSLSMAQGSRLKAQARASRSYSKVSLSHEP